MRKRPTPKPEVAVIITAAVVLEGKIVSPSKTPVLVPEALAQNLMHRNRATLVPVSDDASDDELDLEGMNLTQLKNEARELEVKGFSGMDKAQLIEAITEALGE